jgi:4'-phosphopantetheinyl transferase EntD
VSSPLRLDALARDGLEVWAHDIHAALRSPFGDENELADELGDKRGPHFVAGRLAAHAAIDALGAVDGALPRGDDGEVVWPAGLVGAIAHTPDLAVAVVGDGGRWLGAGVDVEKRGRAIDAGTRRIVARAEEHPWLDAPPDHLIGSPLVALTSAKEVVFKVYFPFTGVRLRFADAIIEPVPGGFRARLTRELGQPAQLDIRRVVVEDYVVLAGALPRS